MAFLTSFVGSVVGFFIQGIAWNVESLLAARFLAGLFSGSAPVAMAYVDARTVSVWSNAKCAC